MSLTRRMMLVATATFVVAIVAVDARATYGTQTTADEPQYLLTALSLGQDFDLDIGDEIESGAFLEFHERSLNPQTIDLNDDGQRLSPHDPLLPLLLALPMAAGGWVGAKAALAAIAALTAAATLFVAVRRFHVAADVAGWVVGACFITPPLTAYSTQVYPAMPAALAVVLAIAGVTGQCRECRECRECRQRPIAPGDGTRGGWWSWVALAAIVALPWLAVKYLPLGAVLGVALLRRSHAADRRLAALQSAIFLLAGIAYLVLHQRIYGGWTVYAAGDHFVNGEFGVIGDSPNYVARSNRLIGLVIDRSYGIAAWSPAYLAMPMALAVIGRRRPNGWLSLLATIGAGWVVATWLALTMHGFWWPGRQIVPVVPLIVIAMAFAVEQAGRWLIAIVGSSAVGTMSWLWLVAEASTGRRTLVIDFDETSNPWYRAWSRLLPDHRVDGPYDQVLTALWIFVLGGLCLVCWRRAAAPKATAWVSDHPPNSWRSGRASRRRRSCNQGPRWRHRD